MSDLTDDLRPQYEYLRWYLPAEGDTAADHELAVDTLAALDALEAAEAELARLEHQLQQAEEATTAAYKDAEAAEARSADLQARSADLQSKLDAIRTHCQTAIETGTRSDWEEGYDEACLDILDILEAQ